MGSATRVQFTSARRSPSISLPIRHNVVMPEARHCQCLKFHERLRVPATGRLFLDTDLAAASDNPPTSLEHFDLAYRAHVRCTVTCIRARQATTARERRAGPAFR